MFSDVEYIEQKQNKLYLIHKNMLKNNKKVYNYIDKSDKSDISGYDMLKFYKGSISYELNAFIRGEKKIYNNDKNFLLYLSKYLSKIINISKWIYDDIFIYRIVFDKYATMLCASKNNMFNNNGFASWTFDLQRSLELININNHKTTLLRSTLKKGMSYFYIDGIRRKNQKEWLYQNEILLDKDYIFTITNKSIFEYYNKFNSMSKDDINHPFITKIKICLIDVNYIY